MPEMTQEQLADKTKAMQRVPVEVDSVEHVHANVFLRDGRKIRVLITPAAVWRVDGSEMMTPDGMPAYEVKWQITQQVFNRKQR